MSYRPTLCVDFDGVLHAYTSGWIAADVVPDGPVPGSVEWLEKAMRDFDVAVFSSRSNEQGGREAMHQALRKWFEQAGLNPELADYIKFPTSKPPAFLSIDDRCVRFEGDWSELDPKTLLNFKPWNK